MKPFIEIEYKVLVTKAQYDDILSKYPNHKKLDQTNYYFDTYPSLKNKGIGMRIRQVNNEYIFTLKEKLEKGHTEYEFNINDLSLDDERIQNLFEKLNIKNPILKAQSHTLRHEVELQNATLCIDENEFYELKDYEIEYELKDPNIDGLDEFKNILNNSNIEYIPNKISKIQRAMDNRPIKCAMFLANGFEECEGLIVHDLLWRANIHNDLISINGTNTVTSSHNVKIETALNIKDINIDDYDCIILPGGMPGTLNLKDNQQLISFVEKHYANHKLTCAICAAPSILGHIKLLENKNFTCYPSFEVNINGNYQERAHVVQDKNIITSCGLGGAFEFGLCIVKNLLNIDAEEVLKKQIIY